MPLTVLPGGFAGWYGTAVLLWVGAAAFGMVRRRGSGPLLPVLVRAGSGLLFLTAIAGGNGVLRLPLPWFLGAASVELIGDPLSRWFLAIIGLVGSAATLFSPGYLHHLRQRVDLGFVWAALALLMASMSLVALAGNALVF